MTDSERCQKCDRTELDLNAGGFCPDCQTKGVMRDMLAGVTSKTANEDGDSIGGYFVEGELARGGMGVIYRARQPKVDRLVALKVIGGEPQFGMAARERFRMEMEAVARLDHPNIVPIYEIGEHGDRPFFTMRLLNGGTLSDQLKDYRADGDSSSKSSVASSRRRGGRAVECMIKIARAIEHAHQHGIIHRDLKPSNILLDHNGEPFVADFGLAKRMGDDSDLTLSGAVIGTPAYMSPEQASGKGRDVTVSSDVFSLGAILYHLLTGEAPFKGDSPLEVMRQVVDSEVISPSAISRSIDHDLGTICQKAMVKEPERRYQSAGALADDLQNWLDGKPITARPISSWERAMKWARRNPASALLLAFAVTGMVTIYGQTLLSREELKVERDAAHRLAEEKAGETARALAAEERMRVATEERTSQLNRSDYREAATRFRETEPAEGLAWLARILRRSPDYAPARDRALFELGRFRAAEAVVPAMSAKGTGPVVISPDGQRLFGASHGKLAAFELATGRVLWRTNAHADFIDSMAVSADGKVVATASLDTTVKIWSAESGAMLLPPLSLGAKARGLAFRNDGRELLATGWPWRGLSWSLTNSVPKSGRHVLRHGSGYSIQSLHLSGGGNRWFIAQNGGKADIVDSQGGRLAESFEIGLGNEALVEFSRSEDRVACRVGDLAVEIRRVPDGDVVRRVTFDAAVTCLMWDRDDRRLFVGLDNGSLRVCDTETGHPVGKARDHRAAIRQLDLSHDGELLGVLTSSQQVAVWDLAAPGRGAIPLAGHVPVMRLKFSPNARRLVTVAPEGAFHYWRFPKAATVQHQLRFDRPGHALEFSGDNQRLAITTTGDEVMLHRVIDGALLASNRVAGRHVFGVELSQQGDLFAVGGKGKKVVFLNPTNAATVGKAVGGYGWVDRVRFSPDDTLAAVVHLGRSVSVIDVATSRKLWSAPRHPSYTPDCAFTPDGMVVVSACVDGGLRFFHARDGKSVRKPIMLPHGVEEVEFSPGGGHLLAAQNEGGAVLLDWKSGEIVQRFVQEGWITAVHFNAEGTRIFTAARDGTVRIWDPQSGRQLTPPMLHSGSVEAVAFTSSGRQVVAGTTSGEVDWWDVESGLHLGRVSSHVGPVHDLDVSRDGQWVASSAKDGTFVISQIPAMNFDSAAPTWFPDLLERFAGLRIGDTGAAGYLVGGSPETLIPKAANDAFAQALRRSIAGD